MYAITILQPWAHLSAIGVKDIENRGWVPNKQYIGQGIAIHAGKGGIYQDDLDYAERKLGRALHVGRLETAQGCIIATAILDSVVVASASEWYSGRKMNGKNNYGLVLKAVRRCEPIPCTGALSLWRVPPSVLRRFPEECR